MSSRRKRKRKTKTTLFYEVRSMRRAESRGTMNHNPEAGRRLLNLRMGPPAATARESEARVVTRFHQTKLGLRLRQTRGALRVSKEMLACLLCSCLSSASLDSQSTPHTTHNHTASASLSLVHVDARSIRVVAISKHTFDSPARLLPRAVHAVL